MPSWERSPAVRSITSADYADLIASPFADELVADGVALLVVEDATSRAAAGLPGPGSLPVVVASVGDTFGEAGPPWADLVVGHDDLDELVRSVAHAPQAARALAVLLRAVPAVGFDEALGLESATYSLLQAGSEFAAWRSTRPGSPQQLVDDRPTVRIERRGDTLRITLDRPSRHNAITARLRDELAAALAPAVLDDTLRAVEIVGAGPSFCSGGDLDEFGARPDPVLAHTIRLARSPVRLIRRLAPRTTVRVHGATLGGGLEMAAAAGRVVAAHDTRLGLPEIGLGLIPGAGGTVSITARIGRQRTAALALTGRTIGVDLALAWGLVDEISPSRSARLGPTGD